MKFNFSTSIAMALAVAATTAFPLTVKAASEEVASTDMKTEQIATAEDGKVGPQSKYLCTIYPWICPW